MPTIKQRLAFFRAHGEASKAFNAFELGKPPENIHMKDYPQVLINALGGAYMPDQFPPVGLIPKMIPGNIPYFEKVHAVVRENVEKPGAEVAKLGKAFGRWFATMVDMSPLPPPHGYGRVPGVTIGEKNIITNEGRIPLAIEAGRVIEFGMGVSGLLGHRDNLRDGRYKVTHIGASPLENMVLDGIAGHYGIDESQLVLEDRGIASIMSDLVDMGGNYGEVDAVIGSRVHAAKDLRSGIACARDVLRTDGVLALRGPEHDSQGTGYNDAADMAYAAFGSEAVVLDERFTALTPYGTEEANRTLLVRNQA